MSRRAQTPKPVAAARPLMTTTASNPNVALRNKKINSQHHIPASNPSSSHLCFQSTISIIFVLIFVVLAQGKNQSYPSEGGDSCFARRHFPCVSSFTAVPALFVPPPLPFSSSLCGTEVFIKKRRAMNAHLILLKNRLTHFIDDADDTLMILIKIGSCQADMFEYESGCCGVCVHL